MTKNELEAWCPAVERMFGYGLPDGAEDLHTVGSDRSGFTYREGVPAMYMSRTGKKVVRADVNGIVRMASQSGYFNAAGGYYTFDPAVAEAIGGYPYGAILRWRDPATGAIRIVRSQKPDNTADFVADPNLIDGENWAFADDFAPASCRPRVYPQWDIRQAGFSDNEMTQISVSQPFTAVRPGILYIQGGANENECVAEGNSEILVWANVREAGKSDFHAAGLLAYIPPVNTGYQSTSQSADLVDPRISRNIGYTSLYSPGYVALWLVPGDTVSLSANIETDFHALMCFVPLLSADEMDARTGGSDFPEGGGDAPSGGGGEIVVTVPHAMRVVSVLTGDIQLYDQTTHVVAIPTATPSLSFILPPQKPNISREFEIVLDVPETLAPPSLTFSPNPGESVQILPVDGDYSIFYPTVGVTVFKFREIRPGKFLISRGTAE